MSKLTLGQRKFPTLGLRSQQPKNYVGPTLSCYLGSPALATCETSQVLLVGVSGGFHGVLPFRPIY